MRERCGGGGEKRMTSLSIETQCDEVGADQIRPIDSIIESRHFVLM